MPAPVQVRGITTSLVVDITYVLEAHHQRELPEALLGAVRFKRIDLGTAIALDTSLPPTLESRAAAPLAAHAAAQGTDGALAERNAGEALRRRPVMVAA